MPYLGVFGVVGLCSFDPPRHHMVADRIPKHTRVHVCDDARARSSQLRFHHRLATDLLLARHGSIDTPDDSVPLC